MKSFISLSPFVGYLDVFSLSAQTAVANMSFAHLLLFVSLFLAGFLNISSEIDITVAIITVMPTAVTPCFTLAAFRVFPPLGRV